MDSSFEDRKKKHFFSSLKSQSQSSGHAGFDKIQLIHSCLPELDITQVSIDQKWGNLHLKTPFFVSSMTGAWSESLAFNLKLAKACEKRSWMMGVGSQRAQLQNLEKAKEWESIRKACPHVILLGNLGLSQLKETSRQGILSLIESLKAQGMIIHLNPLQEALQKEGTAYFKGGFKALKNLVQYSPVPVIVKETGCGFSREVLDRLTGIGLSVVDLSGMGGTHWGRIEGGFYKGEESFFGIGESFSNWGISTCQSLIYSQEKTRDYDIWASGGLRTGVEACKALAMGAKFVGFGHIILKALNQSEKDLDHLMSRIEYELKVSLFCTGSSCIEHLQRKKKWQKVF
ncbi:MAG: type 2 isopentenyl-diphosphate Delta-isomerase [Bdellovibrionales bacterium]|nr:type 2 isopentenyl-diphosphate Delta-isomerase [Bdellovibrionales bacterium]